MSRACYANDREPTWIDDRMVDSWQYGDRARYYTVSRWCVCLDESHSAFIVLSTNASHGSFGGDDTSYTAEEVASAIDRWATPIAGLEAPRQFLEALERNVAQAKIMGTQMEFIRAKYLLDSLRARVAMADAEDAKPFTGCGQPQVHDKDDDLVGSAPIIVDWDGGR